MSIFSDFDAAYGAGTYSSVPMAGGATEILHDGAVVDQLHPSELLSFEHGHTVMHTADPISGQRDTLVDGHLTSTTQPNVFGGEDVYHGSTLHHMTIPNQEGGVDIYDGSMHPEGSTLPNTFGGEDYLAGEGNSEAMLHYADPLAHSGAWHMDPFNVAKK